MSVMNSGTSSALLPFSRWPQALADRYRTQGLWTDQPLTDILIRHQYSEAPAIIDNDRVLSYAMLERMSSALAAELAGRGLGHGDTALVQLPNIAEFYLVYFALLKIGVAPVNALFSHQKIELTAYAEQLNPALLIASAEHSLFASVEFTRILQQCSPNLCQVLILGSTDYAEELVELFTEKAIPPTVTYSPTPADEVAFFQLSGGSTGTPKLIPRTHNDYYYSIRRSAEICSLSSDTRYLCALPAAHNYPLSSPGALGVFYAGGGVVMAPDPEPLRCFKLIEQYAVTMTSLVPSAVSLWLQTVPGREQQLASLTLLQVGGASFAETLARRVPVQLGCQLQQVFGMAEGLVNYTRLDDSDEHIFTTQGRPMSDADEVLVLDPETGDEVAEGETGMLLTRGPYTFRGYFNAAEHNAGAFNADGFYSSGDLVQRAADGYLKVVGRVKDQINRGGEKIAAEEIESLLLKHPHILGAALISVPDVLLGEKSLACIVTSDVSIKAITLRKYLRELGLADYKLPDKFRIVSELPLTAVGKTDKKQLRQMMAEIAAEQTDAVT